MRRRRSTTIPGSVSTYELLARTTEEQTALEAGDAFISDELPGPLDDWFTVLNLGYRVTALGNSDTHSKTKTEAGCPRNYVQLDTDDPAEVTPAAVAQAVKEGRVVASYGPFVRVGINSWANGPGTTVQDPDDIDLFIEVQSPWFDVDRVELYENGTLIHEWMLEADHDPLVDLGDPGHPHATEGQLVRGHRSRRGRPLTHVQPSGHHAHPRYRRWSHRRAEYWTVRPSPRSRAAGRRIPRTFPIHPFALTNPIWVDKDGDGFDPPGIPDWLERPPSDDESKGKPFECVQGLSTPNTAPPRRAAMTHHLTALILLAACASDKTVVVRNSPPGATITSPAEGIVYEAGALVEFKGIVSDAQTSNDELVVTWDTDKDGLLTDEAFADVDGLTTFSTADLTPERPILSPSARSTPGVRAPRTPWSSPSRKDSMTRSRSPR